MTELDSRTDLGLDAFHWERAKLAVLGRIIAELGYIGAMGHVSARVPGTEVVLVSPGAGFDKSELSGEHIFLYDVDGNLLHHPAAVGDVFIPLERPIHIRIHRDRPEMLCVAHLHARNSTLMGIANKPILPVLNQAFYLHGGVPTWDNPALVVTDEQAGQLSAALGDGLACQMRGHGSVVVGETVEIALMNCYSMEENAGYQIAAEQFGGSAPFDASVVEAIARYRTAMRDGIARVLWTYFEHRVTPPGRMNAGGRRTPSGTAEFAR